MAKIASSHYSGFRGTETEESNIDYFKLRLSIVSNTYTIILNTKRQSQCYILYGKPAALFLWTLSSRYVFAFIGWR